MKEALIIIVISMALYVYVFIHVHNKYITKYTMEKVENKTPTYKYIIPIKNYIIGTIIYALILNYILYSIV